MMERSQILTERQQSELNKAIIQYLQPICSQENNEVLDKLTSMLKIESTELDGSDIVDNYLERNGRQCCDYKRRSLI